MRALLSAGAAAWLAAAAAAAQPVGPPVPLLQPPAAPSPPAPPAPSALPAAPAVPPRTVTSETLTAPEAGWDGDTSPADAALPSGFWQGTPRPLAEVLLFSMPDLTMPALQTLARRLLLSRAAAPAGKDAEGMPRDLAAIRAGLLLRLGEFDGARAVLVAIPEARQSPASRTLGIWAEAIVGNIDDACARVGDAIKHDQSAGWQEYLIACQGLHGDIDKASVGLQLLGEQRPVRDDPLALAVEALAGHSAASEKPNERMVLRGNPLLLRLMVLAKLAPGGGLIAQLPGDLALTLALDNEAPAETRLLAAERAAECGALSADRLRELYEKFARTDGAESKTSSAIGRARLLSAIEKGGRLSEIIAFAEAYPRPEQGGRFVAAGLVAPALRSIEPQPAHAAAAARLLLAAGEIEGARRWSEAAAPGDKPELRLLLRLASGADAADAPLPRPSTADAAIRQLALRMVAAGLGERVTPDELTQLPPTAWTQAGPLSAPPAAWIELTQAVQTKHLGETVLAAILVAAPETTRSKDPAVLYAAIAALSQAGLGKDARRLAVEVALGL